MTALPNNRVGSRKDIGEPRSRAINIRNIIPRYARCAIVTRPVRHRGCYDWTLRSSADERKSRAAGRKRKRFSSRPHLDVSRSSSRISLTAR